MTYLIKATDTSGMLSLHRDSQLSAIKKASELVLDGCWDVIIIDDDGKSIAANSILAKHVGSEQSYDGIEEQHVSQSTPGL